MTLPKNKVEPEEETNHLDSIPDVLTDKSQQNGFNIGSSQDEHPLPRVEPVLSSSSKDVLAPTNQNVVSQETQNIKPVDVNKTVAQKPVTIIVQDTETVKRNVNKNGPVSKSSVESPSLNVKPSSNAVKSITDVLSDMKKNTLVWKDKYGNIFSTFSSESFMETSIADVLDVFYFDRPELIIRLMGNAQKKTSLFKSREVPDLVYCVSYTGEGGINILPQSMRRRFVQLVNDTGAWIVSEYKNIDILESTHQPFVVPEQKEPKFYTDISSWPPNFTYSSVHLGNTRILKESHQPYSECIIVSGGDENTFRTLLELARRSDCLCIIVLKGTGGLADILVSAVLENRHFKDVSSEITAITSDLFEESYSEESDSENGKPKRGIDSEPSKKYLNPASKAKNTEDKGGAPHAKNSSDEELFRCLCKNITIFEPDLTVSDYRLGQIILLSMLKVYPEQKERLLKLCIDLDCFNLAEEHIFSAKENFIRDKECLVRLCLSVIQSAFIKNRTKFIDYFLRQEMFEHMENDTNYFRQENVMASIITDSRAMRFSDETLWEVEHIYSNEFLGICDHLFRQCLVSHKIELSKLFWLKTQNPLGTLLLAAAFLKKLAKKEKNHIIKNELKEAVQQYQTLAATFVRFCYDKDQETTLKMITRKMDQFLGKSCIDLALSSSNLDFLDQPACVTVQRRVWRWGNLWDFYSENPDPEKYLWRKRSKSKNDSQSEIWRKPGIDTDESDNKIQKQLNLSALKKYYLLLCVPMTMFALNGIGLMIFIYIYGLTILGRFEQYKFHWLELYLLSFVTVVTAEEIFEIVIRLLEKDFKTYISSGWNIVDLLSVSLFYIGAILRVIAYFSTGSAWFYSASIAFSLDFIVFTFRLLHNCYSSPVLGPTCAMIIKTVEILTRFLYIFAIFWASYAVASEAILYPNSVLSYYTFFYLFRKAYWQMFGELFLDEIDAGKTEDTNSLHCTTDPSLYGTYELLRCPTPLGRYYVPVLLAVYVLFTNILLNSLITASFSKSIEKIQQKAEKLWRFQFFLLTRDYSKILFLPVPFTLISILARVCDDDDRKVDGFSVSDKTHVKQYENCLKKKLNSTLSNNPELQMYLSQDIKRMKKKSIKKHSMKSWDIMEHINSKKEIFSKIIMSQKLREKEKSINTALSEYPYSQEILSVIKNLKDFINDVIEYRCCQDRVSAQHPYRKYPNMIAIIRGCLEKVLEKNFAYSEIQEHITDLETLMQEDIVVLELEEKIKNYNIKMNLSEVEKKIRELEKFNKENRTNLSDEKTKALNFIWSRFSEFKKLHAQKIDQVNKRLIHELNVKTQDLWIAVKYYEHISIEPDVRSMLDDLETVLLQETQAGHFYMSDRVRDLELFVLQNFIEPDMYREWQKKEADERIDVEGVQSNRAVSPDAMKADTEDKTKSSPRNRGLEESKTADEELGFNWVPMYKSQMKLHQNKSNKKQTEKHPDKIKFNRNDKKHNIDRRSYLGRYEVNSKGPVNPLWSAEYQIDSSIDEKLPRWGPNHFGVPIITRIKHKDGKIFRKDDKLVIEFLVEKIITQNLLPLKNQSENLPIETKKYRFPEVQCSPSNDPFIEFINNLSEKENRQSDKTYSVPSAKFVQAVKTVITLMKKRKLFLKSQDEIEMKHCQKMMSIYIGPVVRQTYMTEHKWMEIRAINYHNPHTQHQLTIEQTIQTGQSYEWIDYIKYKEVDVITDSKDVFENICTKWGAYVERRPTTARKSAQPTRIRTAKK